MYSRNFAAELELLEVAVDGWLHEPQHVELVGDELRVREEITRKAAVAVGQVERHPAHVLAPADVLERGLQHRAFPAPIQES